MPVAADGDQDYAAAYALAEWLAEWLMGIVRRTKPEYNKKEEAYKNMSSEGEAAGRNPNGNGTATCLGRIFRPMRRALKSRKEPSPLELFQTKPEYYRKEGAYKNVSKTLGWVVVSCLTPLPKRSHSRAGGESMSFSRKLAKDKEASTAEST